MGGHMRSFATSFIAILVTIAVFPIAHAEPPDMTGLQCAWEKLAESEQRRLTDAFKVDLREGGFTIHFASADTGAATQAAAACALNLAPGQADHLALALSRRAAEEEAKKGISDKGEDPKALRTALGKMHQGKREVMGDALGCPGPHSMVTEWDESLKGAIRRANLRFKDGRAYAWVSLGVYAIVAQEGALRRMVGKASACSS